MPIALRGLAVILREIISKYIDNHNPAGEGRSEFAFAPYDRGGGDGREERRVERVKGPCSHRPADSVGDPREINRTGEVIAEGLAVGKFSRVPFARDRSENIMIGIYRPCEIMRNPRYELDDAERCEDDC